MKDNLIDTLKNLLIDSIENTLGQRNKKDADLPSPAEETHTMTVDHVMAPQEGSYRIFDEEECAKLDLYCRNFLLRVEQLGLLLPKGRESIIEQLLQSDSEIIGFDEAKWIFINSLNTTLTEEQLIFLDFVLSDESLVVH